jgi:sugar lactone lactonase YvrE
MSALAFASLAHAQTTPAKENEKPAAASPKAEAKPAIPSREAAFATEATVIATGLSFAEGPLLLAAGKDAAASPARLLMCDLGGDALFSTTQLTTTQTPATVEKLLAPSGRAAGATLDNEGHLLLARFSGSIARSSKPLASLTKDEAITLEEVVASAEPMGGGAPVKLGRCNDLIVTPWGDIFFTDFGGRANKDDPQAKVSKGLFRLTSVDGKQTAICVDDQYKAANGLAFDASRNTLYVADFGASLVIAYTLNKDAPVPTSRRVFADLSTMRHAGGGQVDGMKVDAATGNLLTTGPGGIWAIAPDGTLLSLLPIRGASNIAIGEGRTIYITAGADVLTAELGVAKDPAMPARK